MNKLLIRILESNSSQQIEWALIDDMSNIDSGPGQATLEQLHELMEQYPCTLIVPSTSVVTINAELPPLTGKKLYQAIPFSLEDQIIDAVESQHFALGAQIQPNCYSVGIVARQQMDSWLAPWQNPNYELQAIIPESMLIPRKKNTWAIILENNIATVRTEEQLGFQCEIDNLQFELNSLLNESQPPESIDIYHILAKYPIDLRIDVLVEHHLVTQPTVQLLAEEFISQKPINLLQGPYRRKKKSTFSQSQWKIPTYLCAVLLLLTIIYTPLAWITYKTQSRKLDKQINETYFKLFPNASELTAPRTRVQQKLNAIENSESVSNFFSTLALIGEVFSQQDNIGLDNLTYQPQGFNLTITADNFSTLEKFDQDLRNNHLSVQQSNATTSNNKVSARLEIKGEK